MENIEWNEDPVIEEIRAIRQSIHDETEGMTNEERVAWYNEQAKKAMEEFAKQKVVCPMASDADRTGDQTS